MDLFKTRKIKDLNVRITALQRSLIIQQSGNYVNKNIAQYPNWNIWKQTARYCNTDDVYSIIRLIATTCALVPMYAYLVKDEKAYSRINWKNFDPRAIFQTKMLQLKALEDLPDTDRLYTLLENPHSTLSKFEFLEAIYTLLPLQGECILYKIRAEIGVNEGKPISLEILESTNVIRYISDFPHRITRYDYTENGVVIMKDIPPEDIIHIRYFKTLSPLQALHKRLIRMDSEMDVSVAQMQNGGVPGVIYHKDNEVDQEITTADQHKENFYNYLQNRKNKGAPYWAGTGDLGYIELGLKLADMSVAELSKIDFKKLCNAFGVSDVLFNNDAASTESNIKVQETRLYTNTCLPSVYRVRDALIKGLVDEYRDNKKRTIDCDISEIAPLQEDMKRMAETVSALPYFIPNAVQRMFKLEESDDPNMNEVYIKTGYVKLADLQGVQDLPITEDY